MNGSNEETDKIPGDMEHIMRRLSALRTTEEVKRYKRKLEKLRGVMPADQYCFMKDAVDGYENQLRKAEKGAVEWHTPEDVEKGGKPVGDVYLKSGGCIFALRQEECAVLAAFIRSAQETAWKKAERLLAKRGLAAALCSEELFGPEHFVYLIRPRELVSTVWDCYADRGILGEALSAALGTMTGGERKRLRRAMQEEGRSLAYWKIRLLVWLRRMFRH